jgi:hypothetical protein
MTLVENGKPNIHVGYPGRCYPAIDIIYPSPDDYYLYVYTCIYVCTCI